MKNKRLSWVFSKALQMNLSAGIYPLDGYNCSVVTDNVMFAVTTRINACSNYFLLEVYD